MTQSADLKHHQIKLVVRLLGHTKPVFLSRVPNPVTVHVLIPSKLATVNCGNDTLELVLDSSAATLEADKRITVKEDGQSLVVSGSGVLCPHGKAECIANCASFNELTDECNLSR